MAMIHRFPRVDFDHARAGYVCTRADVDQVRADDDSARADDDSERSGVASNGGGFVQEEEMKSTPVVVTVQAVSDKRVRVETRPGSVRPRPDRHSSP
jgi:hypothetical protein